MSEFDFQPYLAFVRSYYGSSQGFYTPTDAILPLQVRSVEKEHEVDGRRAEQKVEQFPVLEGLRRYALGTQREHVLLAGRPGSGKSMALRQLVVQLAQEGLDQQGLVPVLVQLKGDRTVPELIQAEFRRAKVKVTQEQIDDWLLTDRLILLLDGVNEIPTEDLRRQLAQFREENLSVPMVLTTRDLAIGGDLGIEKRFEMKPLSSEQLREFVGKYLPEGGTQLLQQLRDRLREVAETPLLLKMLCDVFKQTGKVPQNKGELFRGFDREYEKFKGMPAVSEEFRRFKSEVLQHLAYTMMVGDGGVDFELTIDRGDAEGAIEALLKGRVDAPGAKAKEWLEDLVEHHLLQVAVDGRRVEFHHQLFQEYYAAEWLLVRVRGMDDETLECEFLNLLKWTETVGLMLGLVEDEGLAVRVVERGLGVDLIFGAKLAGAVRSEFQEKGINLFANSAAISDQAKVELFKHTRSAYVIEKILLLLSTSQQNINDTIVSALSDLGEEPICENTPQLLDTFEKHKAHEKIFGSINFEEYGKVTLEDLEYEEHQDKQFFWLGIHEEIFYREELGDLNDGYFDFLLKLINPDSSLNDTILQSLESSNKFIRLKAIEAIKIFKVSAFQKQLILLLEDQDAQIRRAVIAAFEKFNTEAVSQELIEFWKVEQDVEIREALESVLSNFISPTHLCFFYENWNQHGSWRFLNAIQNIQSNCKFYNYEIHQKAQTRHPPGKQQPTPSSNVYITTQELTLMSTQPPIFNQQNATIGVNYAAENSNPQITQNIQAQPQSSPETALLAIIQIIQALEQKHSQIASPQQTIEIIDAEFKELKSSQPLQWQNLLSVKRLYNGGKKAALKLGEHFAEENPWGKGFVAFLEGFSEDVK